LEPFVDVGRNLKLARFFEQFLGRFTGWKQAGLIL
jgi:hypothetical protein